MAPAGAWQGWVSQELRHLMSREETLVFIKSCQHACGGISTGHDPHLGTPSDVQILTLRDSITVAGVNKVECFQSTGRRQVFCLVWFFSGDT